MVTLHRSKTSSEKKPYTLNFTNALPSATTVSSATASAIKLSDGTADDSILAETTLTTTSSTAIVRVLGGTSGETYRIKVVINGSDSFLLDEVYIFLKVQDVPSS